MLLELYISNILDNIETRVKINKEMEKENSKEYKKTIVDIFNYKPNKKYTLINNDVIIETSKNLQDIKHLIKKYNMKNYELIIL